MSIEIIEMTNETNRMDADMNRSMIRTIENEDLPWYETIENLYTFLGIRIPANVQAEIDYEKSKSCNNETNLEFIRRAGKEELIEFLFDSGLKLDDDADSSIMDTELRMERNICGSGECKHECHFPGGVCNRVLFSDEDILSNWLDSGMKK